MPTSGRDLTQVALSATLHCLTGCAIGEVLGMVIGTALGFSELGTVALAVGLAFLFGYALTSLPLLRAGWRCRAVVPIALASDTLSIATMEIVDNAIVLAVPGAMEAGVGSILFWGSLVVRARDRRRRGAAASTAGSSGAARATPSCTRPASTAARRRASSASSRPRVRLRLVGALAELLGRR